MKDFLLFVVHFIIAGIDGELHTVNVKGHILQVLFRKFRTGKLRGQAVQYADHFIKLAGLGLFHLLDDKSFSGNVF